MSGLRRALIAPRGRSPSWPAIGSAALILTSDHDEPRGLAAALILTAGWGFAGTGLYAWDRRPGNNIGPLMTAIGFTWFFQGLQVVEQQRRLRDRGRSAPRSPTRSSSTSWSASPPAGSRPDFSASSSAPAYLTTTVLQLAWAFFIDPTKQSDCDGCPENPILISGHEGDRRTRSTPSRCLIAILRDRLDRGDRLPALAAQHAGAAPRPHPGRRSPAGVAFTILLAQLILSEVGVPQAVEDGRLRRRDRRLRLPSPSPSCSACCARGSAGRRRSRTRAQRRERAAQRRAAGQGRGAARLARADRRGRLRRAPAGRARPPRRRPAAPDGADDEPAAGPRQARAPTRRRPPSCSTRRWRSSRAATARAARARPRHPPGGAQRPRPRRGARRPRRTLAGAGRDRRDARPSGCRPGRVATYFVVAEALTNVARYADAERRDACGSSRENGAVEVEVRDDGVGGADLDAGTGLRGLEDRVAALEAASRSRSRAGRGDHRGGEDPVRVVVADDSTLLREGLVRLLEEAGPRGRRPGRRRRGAAAQGPRPQARRRRRRRADAADPHRRGPARRARDPRRAARGRASWSSPSTSKSPTPASSWPRAPRASATC